MFISNFIVHIRFGYKQIITCHEVFMNTIFTKSHKRVMISPARHCLLCLSENTVSETEYFLKRLKVYTAVL